MTQITLVICPSFGFFKAPRVVGEAGKVKFPFSNFKIRKCMNEMWVTESHGNGPKCWEEGTKYWVVEVIKNVTGQVIEL